ncbi:MAG: hypothetical protein JWM32_459 [Verrucomicrobia bacterium]|nr:hypothetical protein [Verrucomicrobiota bacterium]
MSVREARAVVYTWNSGDIVTGSISPSGTLTINSADTLDIHTGNDHDLNGRLAVNNGTVLWVNGDIRGGNGGGFVNNATWNDSANSSQINNAFGGSGGTVFNNAVGGSYNKTSGLTTFNIGFTNQGTINVSGGTLNLAQGGTFSNGSVAGSSGSGILKLTGGTLTMTGNVTLTNFLLLAGTFSGNHTLTGSTINWQDGNMNGAFTTTLASGTSLTITTGADKDLNAHALVNYGTINWTNGNLRSGNGGVITNHGLWVDTANGDQINNAFGGTGGTTFINAADGTYTKTSGTSSFEVGFINYGAVSVTGGTLNIDAGGTFYNGSTIGSSGTGVVQLTGGLFTGAGGGNFTATNLLLTGGTIGDGIVFLGTTNWISSNFNGVGTSQVGAGATLNVSSGADHDLQSHTVVNSGTVNWQAGNIRSGSGGIITNHGTWNDTADTYQVNNAFGGTGGTTFQNASDGTYHKISGVSTLAGVLVNDGVISVTGGTLNLVGGTLNDNSTIGSSGSGVVQLTSGTLTGSGTLFVQNFLLSGGVVAGTQTFQGTLSWLASAFSGSGTSTFGSGSTLSILTGNDHDYNGRTLVNNGTVAWTAGNIRSGNGGSFTNNSVWNDSSNGFQINNAFGGSGGTTFTNNGTYNKTAGTTTLAGSVLVNNGTISVSNGTLNLDGGILNNGSTIGSSGTGTVQLVSSNLVGNGTLHVQNFLLTGGSLSGTQAFDGSLNWVATTLGNTGSTTITNTGAFTISSGNDHDFNSHTIVNNGTVTWTAGNLRSGSGGSITNNGTWNDSASYQVNNAFGGSGGTTFANNGTYNKTGGTSILANGVLVNNGIINVSAGTLTLDGGLLNTGSSLVSTGSGLAQLNSGALSAIGTVNVQNFLLNGGVLLGSQTFTGSLSWVATDLNTAYTTTADSAAAFIITSGSDHNFSSHTIVNNGTVTWVAGDLRSGNGGRITNNGVWNDASSNQINNAYGGAGGTAYVNGVTGVYNKVSGASTMQVPFTNNGYLALQGGSLTLNSTFTSSTGHVTLGAGSTLSSGSALVFDDGSLVDGSGTLTAPSIAMSGDFAPGSALSSGVLNVTANLTLLGVSRSAFGLGGTTVGSGYDQLAVSGTTTLGGDLVIYFRGSFESTVTNGMTFTVLSSTNLAGSFGNIVNGGQLYSADGLARFTVNYGVGSPFGATNVVLSNYTMVPEPSTWALLLSGAGLLALRFRRRRK